MKRFGWMVVTVLALMLALTGCAVEEETAVTGIVTAVEGNTVTLQQFDAEGGMNGMPTRGEGEEGERPAPGGFGGMEGFDPENFDPESFGGEMPEGFDPGNFDPESFGGGMPEGFGPGNFDPESFGGEMPEGFEPGNFDPESFGGEMPEGFQGMGGFAGGEAVTYDLNGVHISVEIEGGKASGSMEDITVGSFVTVTLRGDKPVNVLVSSMSSGWGGFGR